MLNSIPLLCLLSDPTPRIFRVLGSGYDGFGWLSQLESMNTEDFHYLISLLTHP